MEHKVLGLSFSNPLVLASGILGVTGASLANAAKSGAGAVTLKSVNWEGRKGNPGPIIIANEHAVLNSVGLSNPGVKNSLRELEEFKRASKKILIGSIFGHSFEEFEKVTKEISKAPIDMLEVDISCPNIEGGLCFSTDPKMAARVTKIVKKHSKVPVSMKLTPNVADIAEIAKAVEKAGADAITAINTAAGMSIDINAKRPILGNKRGGLSGPSLKPIAIRCVYDIYESVKIPIIGTGGVTTGNDAIEMLMAGASLVGVGSAVYYQGIGVFNKMLAEMGTFMRENNYRYFEEITGACHEK